MKRDLIVRFARSCCDSTSDTRGRETFEFDAYGLERLAALIEQQTMKEAYSQAIDDVLDELQNQMNSGALSIVEFYRAGFIRDRVKELKK